MKKKTIVIMIVTLMLGVTFILFKYRKTDEVVNIGNSEVNYIWDEVKGDALENDYWLRFRRTFTIDSRKKIKNVIAKITVDTRYWLYVNGEMVVREGSLKRGQTKTALYYDEVDITKYLKTGKNTIAILAWHSGIESYSTTPYTQKGLYFEMPFGISSNEEWKVSKYEAYLHDVERPNTRLAEANIKFDGRLDEPDWYKPKFDDSSWKNATIIVNSVDSVHPLIKRDIPLFKNLELKDYENSKLYKDYTVENNKTIGMILPYNMQFTPYLKIESEARKNNNNIF